MKIGEETLDQEDFVKATAYDEMIPWEKRLKREIPLIKDQLKPGTVLDVACSSGRHSFELEKYGFTSLGVDVSREMIFIAQKLKNELNAKSDFLTIDATKSMLEEIREQGLETYYDNAILLGNAIANMGTLKGGKQTIQNIYLLMNPGGRFFCQTVVRPSEPHYMPIRKVEKDNFLQRIMIPVFDETVDHNVDLHVNKIDGKTGEYLTQKADNHFFMYEKEEFEEMVTSFGFELIQVYGGYSGEEPNSEGGSTLVWVFEKPEIPIFEETKTLFKKYWKNREDIDIENEDELFTKIKQEALKVWQDAFSMNHYMCISSFRFLYPRILSHPMYSYISSNLDDKTILDIGCFMGTDIRQLIVDGADPAKLIGTDITGAFFELGYQLYGDKEGTPITFVAGDIASSDVLDYKNKTGELARYQSSIDIIHTGSLLHLLFREDSLSVLKKIHLLLVDDGILFGRMVGSDKEQSLDDSDGLRHIHSIESLEAVLAEIGYKNIQVIAMDEKGPIGERSQKDWLSLMFYARK
ncbi:MAG: Glycine/sarcosine N-methyltransferase [Candidatus Heimdallarchaeota archaeon LC_2]|nr:MAG: Glycine/sarcosine N-methyltransferase [Candidatus Heimdallarchaeota archaeon LC_2]